jgi:hypothetical protein
LEEPNEDNGHFWENSVNTDLRRTAPYFVVKNIKNRTLIQVMRGAFSYAILSFALTKVIAFLAFIILLFYLIHFLIAKKVMRSQWKIYGIEILGEPIRHQINL